MKFNYIISFLLLSCFASAQSLPADSSFLSEAKKNSIAVYSAAMAAQSHLYNGSAYVEYQSQGEEHPYYLDEWTDGMAVYDGQRYEHVAFLYDLSLDKLITDHPYGFNKIQLVSEKLERFTLGDHLFVKLEEETIPKGFYELTYQGNTNVYVRWQKSLQKRTETGRILNEFDLRIKYYVQKEGIFYSVKSKRSIVNVFPENKQDLKRIMRTGKLRLKTDRIKILNRIAEFYDQSKK